MAKNDLQNKINAAIRENMPSQVGEQLQELLSQGEADAKALNNANKRIERLEAELDEYKVQAGTLRDQLGDISQRELLLQDALANLNLREQEIRIKEALNELRETHAGDMVAHMRGVVGDVFGNNKFKYERTIDREVVAIPGRPGRPAHTDEHGNWQQEDYGSPSTFQTVTDREFVDGEGDVPPTGD